MGTRRRTRTLQSKEKSGGSKTPYSATTTRNLPKNELGGVIFGCKHHTFSECLDKQIFGLPASHYSYVRNVTCGLPLFLFNYNDRNLHGIFVAASTGQLNIDAHAWITNEGTEYTPYAAQVRISVQRQCWPLHEEEFKPIIAKNYYAEKLFWFELDKKQTAKLIKLFLLSPMPEKKPLSTPVSEKKLPSSLLPKKKPCPPKAVKLNNVFDVLSYHDADEASEREFENLDQQECSGMCKMMLTTARHPSELVVVNSHTFAKEKNWSELLKDPSSSSAINGFEGLESQKEKSTTPVSANIDVDCECNSSCHGTSKLLPEACQDVVNTVSDSPVPESWEDLDLYENKDTCLQVHTQGSWADSMKMPYSENMTCLDSDTGELKPWEFEPVVVKVPGDALISDRENVRSGKALTPIENYHHHPKIDSNAASADVLTEIKASNFESAIGKVMQEIKELKVTQSQQKQKIEYLEQALVTSNLEIHQLKNQCRGSGASPSYTSYHMGLEDCSPPNLLKDDTVLIVGGFDGHSWCTDFSSYSPSQDHLSRLCVMSSARQHASIVQLNGELYLLGGIHEKVWYDTVESYNPVSNQWFQRPSLANPKGCLAAASLCGKIFAIGGGNGVESYSEVEVFDTNIGRWNSTQPMLEKRFAPAATVINSAIYVTGGYDGRNYLRSAERFDPREHAWSRLGGMNTKRGCHSLIAFKDKIYALGGHNGDKMVCTVEVFDPRIGSWSMEVPMQASRGYFGSFVFRGKMHVFGGVNNREILDTVECYEDSCGWQVTGLTGIGKRCFFSTLVL